MNNPKWYNPNHKMRIQAIRQVVEPYHHRLLWRKTWSQIGGVIEAHVWEQGTQLINYQTPEG